MSRPVFVVVGDAVKEEVRNQIWKEQVKDVGYIVHVDGTNITTNSTQVVAQLKIKGMIEGANVDEGERCTVRLRR